MNQTNLEDKISFHYYRNILIKGTILYVLINILFAWINPLSTLSRFSFYNIAFPGRQRFPYADNPSTAYSINVFQPNALFASHVINREYKNPNDYLIFLIGDSSIWGYLLDADQTLSAHLNQLNLVTHDGRQVKVYNLGYPVMSVTKDLFILTHAMKYKPDLILWFTTLEALPVDKQLFPPIIQHNQEPVIDLIQRHNLNLNPNDPNFVHLNFFQKTIIGQRKTLADLLRLQLYGFMWAATGIDQHIPENIEIRVEDLPAQTEFHTYQQPVMPEETLSFDVLQAGIKIAQNTPVVIINEPMFISTGQNSHIRYNYYYPRWAYDLYRKYFDHQCSQNQWSCLDMWNLIPASEFTNTAIHLTPVGVSQQAQLISTYLKYNFFNK